MTKTNVINNFQRLNGITSPSPSSTPLQSVPLCSSNHATPFADTALTSFHHAAANNEYLLDYSSPVFHQGQRSNTFFEVLIKNHNILYTIIYRQHASRNRLVQPYPKGWSAGEDLSLRVYYSYYLIFESC